MYIFRKREHRIDSWNFVKFLKKGSNRFCVKSENFMKIKKIERRRHIKSKGRTTPNRNENVSNNQINDEFENEVFCIDCVCVIGMMMTK